MLARLLIASQVDYKGHPRIFQESHCHWLSFASDLNGCMVMKAKRNM